MNNWDSGINEIMLTGAYSARSHSPALPLPTGYGGPRGPSGGPPAAWDRTALRCKAAWREGHGRESDDKTRARERGAERLDRTPVRPEGGRNESRDHTARTPAEQAYDVLSDPARRQIYDREAEEIPIRRMESMRPPETVILRRHRARSLLRSNAEWKGGWPHRPTLLSWKQSVFITDLKGELYQLTAGWRHEHVPNRILRI